MCALNSGSRGKRLRTKGGEDTVHSPAVEPVIDVGES